MAARNNRLGAVALLLASPFGASQAHADTVKLRNGDVIERVRATVEGDRVRVTRELGSTTYARTDVAEIVADPEWGDQDELDRRKREAGHDPVQLAGVAAWCADHGFEKQGRDLRELSRGIALEHRLAEITSRKDVALRVAGYLQLVDDMKTEKYSLAEQRVVLAKALEADPENPEVRRALGQVKRGGEWVSLAAAREIDAAAEEQAMLARGLVKYDGRWMTPQAAADAQARKLAIARAAQERADLEARIAAQEAENALLLRSRGACAGDGYYFIAAMPSYAPFARRHLVGGGFTRHLGHGHRGR